MLAVSAASSSSSSCSAAARLLLLQKLTFEKQSHKNRGMCELLFSSVCFKNPFSKKGFLLQGARPWCVLTPPSEDSSGTGDANTHALMIVAAAATSAASPLPPASTRSSPPATQKSSHRTLPLLQRDVAGAPERAAAVGVFIPYTLSRGNTNNCNHRASELTHTIQT